MCLLKLKKGDKLSVTIVKLDGKLEMLFHEDGTQKDILLGSWGNSANNNSLLLESINQMDHACTGILYFHAKNEDQQKFKAEFKLCRKDEQNHILNEIPMYMHDTSLDQLVKSIPIKVEA